jgi:hypothetical protein
MPLSLLNNFRTLRNSRYEGYGCHFCYVPFEISFLEKQSAINLVTADVTFLMQPMPRALIPVAQLQRASLN